MKYTNICQAILKHKDWKKRMVEWMMMFEATRVVDFDRDVFMMEMVRCKKRLKK